MVQSIKDFLPPVAAGGSPLKGNWDMSPVLTELLPILKNDDTGVTSIVDANNHELHFGANPPLVGGFYYTAAAIANGLMGLNTTGTYRIRIPTYDVNDTTAVVGLTLIPDDIDLNTLFTWWSLPSNPGDGRFAMTMSLQTAALNTSSIGFVDNGVGSAVNVETVLGQPLVAGDDIYLSVNRTTGAVTIQQNDNAPVPLYTFSSAFAAKQNMLPAAFAFSTAIPPVWAAGSLNFDLSCSVGGRTPMTSAAPAAVPAGSVDHDRYTVTAGGPFANKQTQTGDVVELVNNTTDIIITRLPADTSGLATKEELAAATAAIPADGIIKQSVIDVYSDVGFSFPAQITSMTTDRKLLLTDYTTTPYPQWVIDAGLTVGDLFYVDADDQVVVMDTVPGQKIRILFHAISSMPDGSPVPEDIILEDMSDKPNYRNEVFGLIGDHFGTGSFYRIVRDTRFAVSKEWVTSYVEKYKRLMRKKLGVNYRELLRGGLILNDGTNPLAYDSSLSRKFAKPFGAASLTPAFNAEMDMDPKGRLLAIPAGFNVLLHDFERGLNEAIASGATGSYWVKWDRDGEWLYRIAGAQSRIRRWKFSDTKVAEVQDLYGDFSGTNDPAMGYGAFSQDGNYLAVGGNPGTYTNPGPDLNIRIVDLDTFTEYQVVDISGEISAMTQSFNFDIGQNAAGNTLSLVYTDVGINANVYIRNITTPGLTFTHSRADGNTVLCAIFLPNYDRPTTPLVAVLSYAVNDYTIEIVDPDAGQVIGTLTSAGNPVITLSKYGIRMSPCGTYLAVAGCNIVDISDPQNPVAVSGLPAMSGRAVWMHS